MPAHTPKNLHVALLRGGPSPEYDLSLSSGAHALKTLNDEHRMHDIYINKRGKWHAKGVERSARDALSHADVVLNMLHGDYGEDGEVQKILSQFSIPFSGSTASPSALAYHKAQTKNILAKEGVPVPHGRVIRGEDYRDVEQTTLSVFRSIPLPVIIKPIAGGASHGVSLAHDFESLKLGIEMGLRYADAVLAEEYVKGHLVSIGLIENFRGAETYALLPLEIRFPRDEHFLDYRKKDARKYLIPRHIPHSFIRKAEQMALEAHKSLGLRHYSRAEFIISPTRGVYFIEINSHPDLSEDSPFIHALKAGGASSGQFFSHLLHLTQKRP